MFSDNVAYCLRAWRGAVLLTILASSIAAAPSHAETTAKDVQIILKSIGFLASKPSGAVDIAVVFNPSDAASKKDAEAIKALLDAAPGGSITPKAVLLGVDKIGTFTGPVAVAAAGVTLDAAKGHKVLTVSTDASCAQGGKCILSVHSTPNVEILFNGGVAQASGIEFLPTFRMMITEL